MCLFLKVLLPFRAFQLQGRPNPEIFAAGIRRAARAKRKVYVGGGPEGAVAEAPPEVAPQAARSAARAAEARDAAPRHARQRRAICDFLRVLVSGRRPAARSPRTRRAAKTVHLIAGPEQQKSACDARLSGRRPLPAPERGGGVGRQELDSQFFLIFASLTILSFMKYRYQNCIFCAEAIPLGLYRVPGNNLFREGHALRDRCNSVMRKVVSGCIISF